jgi:hypothetical protein
MIFESAAICAVDVSACAVLCDCNPYFMAFFNGFGCLKLNADTGHSAMDEWCSKVETFFFSDNDNFSPVSLFQADCRNPALSSKVISHSILFTFQFLVVFTQLSF